MIETILPVITDTVDALTVQVYENRETMGKAAAHAVAAKMQALLASQPSVRMVFASAPSQNEFLATLRTIEGIDWSRVTAFHMDEWVGLPADAPQSFARFIQRNLFDHVLPGTVHLIDTTNTGEAECHRYGALVGEQPIDIICLGIGENGHIAFNDPPVADFNDPETMKPVQLDDVCRNQQLHDGPFPSIDDVPTHGITLTIPSMMSGRHLFCMVPGPRKTEAIRRTLRGPISEACPATILRRHEDCLLFLDRDAFGQ